MVRSAAHVGIERAAVAQALDQRTPGRDCICGVLSGHNRYRLSGARDERLSEQKPSPARLPPAGLRRRHQIGCGHCQSAQHPRRLGQAGGEHARARSRRPRPVTFALPGRSQRAPAGVVRLRQSVSGQSTTGSSRRPSRGETTSFASAIHVVAHTRSQIDPARESRAVQRPPGKKVGVNGLGVR